MSTIDHIDTSTLARDLRLAGIAGWAATVMVFTGVIISSSTGAPEPNFDASADKIQRYLETQDPWAVAVGGFLLAFGLVAWLWFVCGLAAALRRSGARPDFLSTVVLVSGTAAVAVMLTGAPQASEYRGGDGLDPQVAQFAFDLTSVTLANMWVALGSLGLATGWAILAGRREPASPGRSAWPAWPAWIGWWALAAGAGYLVVRMAFPSPLWYLPHLLFWVWVLVASTRMLRTRAAMAATPS
jgi:hypothetical protein